MVRVRVPLYAAALATGGAFAILFTGDVYVWFERSSIVYIGGGAFWAMLLAALVATLVGSAGKYRFVLLFPATVLYTLLAAYGLPPLFSLSGWRDLSFRAAGDVYEAFAIMYGEPIPYDLHPGLFVALIPVVMVVVAFATSATLYEGSPVISIAVLGLTIGILSTISFEDGAGPFFAVFLVAAVALLLFSRAERPGAAGTLTGMSVVLLVLAVPQMPLSEATISPGFIDWTRIGTGGTSRLDVQADVGDYLTAGRDTELMRVESPEPLLWRGGTLDYFDGVRWTDTTASEFDDGEEIAPGVPATTVRQEFEILNAQTDVFFGGYKISRTSDEFATENSDGSWSPGEPLVENSSYVVVSDIPQPTTQQLRSTGTTYPPEVAQKYLQLPGNEPPVIAETAEHIRRTYNTETPYDAARAVERYLVYDGGFVYNLDVSYRRADKAIEEFLGDGKEGFCTQFATSMVLLLREQGIPARVVYGATTGRETGPGEYVVTGSNMHTWVEVYFPGVGWYPFDPTPGFSMPSTMEQNAPRPEIPNAGQQNIGSDPLLNRRLQSEQAQQQQSREQTPQDATSAGTGRKDEGIPWPFLLLAPALLLAAVPLAKRALLARGRPEDLYRDLTGRLRDVLPPGRSAIADSPALTPTERILLLAGAAGVEEEPMEGFARAYSRHLYAARTEGGPRDDMATVYRRALRAYERLPLWRRALGAANPASLLARAQRTASAWNALLLKALRARLRGITRR